MRVGLPLRMAVLGVLTLTACTTPPSGSGSGGPTAVSSPGRTSPDPSGSPVASPVPSPSPAVSAVPGGAAWQSTVNFAGTGTEPRPVQVRVYPLQRLRDRVLLTVDLMAEQSTPTVDPFCTGTSCGDLRGVSLIDTSAWMRYGPLRSGDSGPMMTSSTRNLVLKAGLTYRFGALFADPGASSVVVDLQQGGMATGVPVVSTYPAANLISTRGAGTGGWNPVPVTVGTLVTLPVPALTGRFQANRHPLTAKIVGDTVNDGPGMVTISSDAIFEPGTATLSARGPGRIQRAAELLSARADPSRPVVITGFTDRAGTTSLSLRQARAVRTQLAGRLKQYRIQVQGRGAADPVAAGLLRGEPSAAGRALNRHIEVAYTAKAPASPSASSPMPAPSVSVAAPVRTGPGRIDATSRAMLTATVTRVQVVGGMTLVSLFVRADQHANPVGAFSTRTGKRTNLSAFHLIDPATGRVFVPAHDTGNPDRVAGTFVHRFEAATDYQLAFLTTALPAELTAVDVALAGIGTATGVTVTR